MTVARMIPAARIARADATLSPRRLGAVLTAAAVALAVMLATALPAKAKPDAEDYLKTIIGLAIIGAIADAAKDDHRRDDSRWVEPGWDKHYKPAPEAKKKKKGKTVPAVCAIQINGKKRDAVVYSEGCLRRVGLGRNLPYHCSNEAKIYGRWDRIFSEQCLRSAGYRLEGGKRY